MAAMLCKPKSMNAYVGTVYTKRLKRICIMET